MKAALNYSPQAAELLAEGVIEVDVYKCPDWPGMIADAQQQRPAYVHFPLMAGWHHVADLGLENIERLMKQTRTPYVNMHLAPRATDFGMPLDTRDPTHHRRLADAVLDDIDELVDYFGASRVILENVPWDPDPKYAIPRPVLEPDFVCRMVCDTGCGLLLDTAHARIAAKYLGMDEYTYIASLPVQRLRELHITGLEYDSEAGVWRDHFAMTDEDWALAEWVFERIRSGEWGQPWVVALEYGGTGEAFAWRSREEVIAADFPRLYALAHRA